MVVDDRRPRGMLGPSDREFLEIGEEKYGGKYSRQAVFKRREAIRERVENGVLDMALLVEGWDPEERQRVFEPPTTGEDFDPHTHSRRGQIDRATTKGLIGTVAFALLASHDLRVDMGDVVEHGVTRAYEEAYPDRQVLDVPIQWRSKRDLVEKGKEAMDMGTPLTDEQKVALLESGEVPADELREYIVGGGVWHSAGSGEPPETGDDTDDEDREE